MSNENCYFTDLIRVDIPKDVLLAATLSVFCETTINTMVKIPSLIEKQSEGNMIVMVTPSFYYPNDGFDPDVFDYQDGKYTIKNKVTFLDDYHQIMSQIDDQQVKEAIKNAIEELR